MSLTAELILEEVPFEFEDMAVSGSASVPVEVFAYVSEDESYVEGYAAPADAVEVWELEVGGEYIEDPDKIKAFMASLEGTIWEDLPDRIAELVIEKLWDGEYSDEVWAAVNEHLDFLREQAAEAEAERIWEERREQGYSW